MKDGLKYSLMLFIGMISQSQGVSADNHGTGFNPVVILLPPIVFLLIMLIFTYKTWYIPRQREKKEKELLREGLILKNSTKPEKREKAILNLQELARDLDNSKPQIPILAKLSLLEFSLLRIKEEEDALQIGKIKNTLDDLLMVAQKHILNRLIVEIYIMQSKVALIEQDVEKSNRLLTKAELLAEQKQYSDLLEKIEDERISYSKEFKESTKGLTSLELASKINLDDQLFVTIQELKEKYEGLPVDTPVWMMMMSSSGVTLYSMKFLAGLYIDDQLFGGFITAINKFSKEVFGDDGKVNFKTVSSSIDYIKYGEFNLVLKPVSNYLFCYVIKGKTDNAKSKLEEVSTKVKRNSEIWNSFANFEESQTMGADIDNLVTNIIEDVLFTTN